MKKVIFLFLFLSMTSLYSQLDSALKNKIYAERNYGISLLMGIGEMSAGIGQASKGGFSFGANVTYNYNCQTITMFAVHGTKNEADYVPGRDLTNTFNATSFAIGYGFGLYEEHFSGSFVAGIGYTDTWMRYRNPDPLGPIFVNSEYVGATGVFGIQAAAHGKGRGVGAQVFYCGAPGFSELIITVGFYIRLQGTIYK